MANPWNYVAKKITHAVGGDDLTDYAGAKLAKAQATAQNRKYVTDTTSAKKALVSAVKVAATVAPGGAYLKVAKKAAKPVRSFKMGKKTVKVTDTTNGKYKKGRTINKGDEWSDW